jgi:quinoprotein relay system zinc metallohydrolase 2
VSHGVSRIRLGLAWLAGWCCAAPLFAAEMAPLPVQEVAPGVYVHFGAQEEFGPANGGDIANIGFIVGERCVAVVDTGGSLDVGRRLRAAIERTTRVPVCFVIDTHMHQDHVLGNAAFAGGAKPPQFIAHEKFAAALAARERFYLQALQRDFGSAMSHAQIVYPTQTVATTLELDLGGRSITLRAWPTSHTDNDLSVYDARTRTLFLSDLLFVGRLPVLDGSLRGWLRSMAALRPMVVAVAIPGHGPSSSDWPAALDTQQAYLQALLDGTRRAIKNKMTIQQAVSTVAASAAEGWLLADQYHRRNVTAAYAELEWED